MSGTIGLPPIPMYLAISKNEQAYVAQYPKTDPQSQAAVAYFEKQAPKLTSADALLKDYRSLQVVLGAFGMSSAINSTALLRQLMTQDPSDPKSLAQRMLNPSYLRFAQFMSQWNPPTLSSATNVSTIANQFMTANFEQSEGQLAPGLQQALYFKRTIGSVTTIPQLMSDPTLLSVAETAANLPQQFGLLDYNQQEKILSKSVDLKQFATSAGVDKFVERYLALNQANSAAQSGDMTLADLVGGSTGSILSILG